MGNIIKDNDDDAGDDDDDGDDDNHDVQQQATSSDNKSAERVRFLTVGWFSLVRSAYCNGIV